MSKILVVEPSRMLQQALILSFFPEHEVKIAETLPDSGAAVKDYDVLVIDATALREKNSLTAQAARVIQSWRVPIIWLDSEDASSVTSRGQFVVVRRPIAREPLFAALAQCLGRSPATKSNGKASQTEKQSKGAAKAPARKSAGYEQQPKVIELVDVVEEKPRQPRNRSSQTRSKK